MSSTNRSGRGGERVAREGPQVRPRRAVCRERPRDELAAAGPEPSSSSRQSSCCDPRASAAAAAAAAPPHPADDQEPRHRSHKFRGVRRRDGRQQLAQEVADEGRVRRVRGGARLPRRVVFFGLGKKKE